MERGLNGMRERSGMYLEALGERSDKPVMAERVLNSALPKAVWLIVNGKHLGRARRERTSRRRVGIANDQAHANGGPTQRLRG